jgi:uncharacterized beta-barrel protein YwiB (DUF1934 family)
MANPMPGTPVQVRISTKITQAEQSEVFNFTETGTLIKMGQTLYLRYTEHSQDGQTTPVTFKLSDNGEIHLTRHNDNEVRMHFAPQGHFNTRYATPAGTILLGVHTERIRSTFELTPLTGEIEVDYILSAQEAPLGSYEIRVKFSE